jgi:WD40 repeat protein
MPEAAPDGVVPLFLRGVTAEKYGMKTGEGVMDLVDSIVVPREDIAKEILTLGVMSDFEPAKKYVDAFKGESFLIVIDKEQKYGEVFLLCVTEAAQEVFLSVVREREEAVARAARAEVEAEEARVAAAFARANIVYEDSPVIARAWHSETSKDTETDIKHLTHKPVRECISLEITRPKRACNQAYRFLDRNVEVGGIQEFRSHKDPHYVVLKESEIGIQAAPVSVDMAAQTTWYRSINKAVQCEAATSVDISLSDMEADTKESKESKEEFCTFLEKAVAKIEQALDDCDTVNLFNETFQLTGDDETADASQADNELRELKNFADPNYSKMKVISCIDWMPKAHGMVAVNAVRNLTLDQRASVAGLTYSSHLLIWDFRQLIRPSMLVSCPYEILTFRFNPVLPHLLVGGCATGQVVLWDLSETIERTSRKENRSGGAGVGSPDGAAAGAGAFDESEAASGAPASPKFLSYVDYSHRRPVADIFWLPANTQINYRGQLVAAEHLDGNCYQFITVSADAQILVWDIRYEAIGQDNVRHIGKAKHVPTEKLDKHSKEGGEGKVGKPLWSPIFRAGLKRLEGVGDLSLCKVSCSGKLKQSVSSKTTLPGDPRSHLMLTTEEGDLLFADICAQKSVSTSAADEDDDAGPGENTKEFLKWSVADHVRPSVALQQSPFFADIVLSVSDWRFHIWRVSVIFISFVILFVRS